MGRIRRSDRVWLARVLWPLAREPGHDIRNVLCRHGSALDVAAPVRGTQVGPARNYDRAKLLVACQSKVRTIHDRAGFASPAAVDSMTRGAGRSIRIGTVL